MKYISVNVGGQTFNTTVKNLVKIPYFKGKLNETDTFIDQNPKYFETILDFARNSEEEVITWENFIKSASIGINEYKFYQFYFDNQQTNKIEKEKENKYNYDTLYADACQNDLKKLNPMASSYNYDYSLKTLYATIIFDNHKDNKILIDCPQAAYIKPEFLILGSMENIFKIVLHIGPFSFNIWNFERGNNKVTFWEIKDDSVHRWIPNRNGVPISLTIVQKVNTPIDISCTVAYINCDTSQKNEYLIVDEVYDSCTNNFRILAGTAISEIIISSNVPINGNTSLKFKGDKPFIYDQLLIRNLRYKNMTNGNYYTINFCKPGYILKSNLYIEISQPNTTTLVKNCAKLTWVHDAEKGNHYSVKYYNIFD